ncbi:hypothetical protein J6590_063899 [Homalodisca vitripennis]|nr:hypothetical protein J6590_063899 [Homalodisca vitripennis]
MVERLEQNAPTVHGASSLFVPLGNAFAHGVWDSLADYPLNPLRAMARRAQAGTLSDDILPGPCVLCPIQDKTTCLGS